MGLSWFVLAAVLKGTCISGGVAEMKTDFVVGLCFKFYKAFQERLEAVQHHLQVMNRNASSVGPSCNYKNETIFWLSKDEWQEFFPILVHTGLPLSVCLFRRLFLLLFKL